MSRDEAPRKPVPAAPAPAPADSTIGSGEGAQTALEALKRKRKLVENPDPDARLPDDGDRRAGGGKA